MTTADFTDRGLSGWGKEVREIAFQRLEDEVIAGDGAVGVD